MRKKIDRGERKREMRETCIVWMIPISRCLLVLKSSTFRWLMIFLLLLFFISSPFFIKNDFYFYFISCWLSRHLEVLGFRLAIHNIFDMVLRLAAESRRKPVSTTTVFFSFSFSTVITYWEDIDFRRRWSSWISVNNS